MLFRSVSSHDRWVWYYHRGNNSLCIGGSTTNSAYKLYIVGSAYSDTSFVSPIFTKSSDRRLKDIIENLGFGAYKYRLKDSGIIAYGYIADEIEKWLPNAVKKNQINGMYDGLDYDSIFTVKINDHDKRIEKLEIEIKRLQSILKQNNLTF